MTEWKERCAICGKGIDPRQDSVYVKKADDDIGVTAHSACLITSNEARIAELEHPFRNADALDWEHLFKMLPDSGHGKFWKAVMTEAREALNK